MLQRTLRVVGAVPATHTPLPQTTTMVDTMMGHCQSADALNGLAAMCLGAEAIVPLIYRPILQALRHFGYGKDATEFFSLHIEEDEDHALTMLAIMQRLLQGQASRREQAIEVGRELIARRVAMFDAIWEYCQTQPATPTSAEQSAGHFSSADFWRVPSQLQQKTIEPLIKATIAPGTQVYTDEYDIYARLDEWGYGHRSVCHGRGEYARDEDGDGFHEIHVNTMVQKRANSPVNFT